MFIELMPLIERRAITVTVAALSGGRIRVNVVPIALAEDNKINEKIGYSNKDKIAQVPESATHALTTPLSLTGTPDEIDAQMAQQLKAYVDSHVALQQSVDRAKQGCIVGRQTVSNLGVVWVGPKLPVGGMG